MPRSASKSRRWNCRSSSWHLNELISRANALDEKVREQLANVASPPGVDGAVCAMPDAHSGYGLPIGGLAAFDPERGGIVSGEWASTSRAGFGYTCGLKAAEIPEKKETQAHDPCRTVPAGVGWGGAVPPSTSSTTARLRPREGRPSGDHSLRLSRPRPSDRHLIRELSEKEIIVKAHTAKGAAEEGPAAYKDVEAVAEVAEATGLSRRVARVLPIACVKG